MEHTTVDKSSNIQSYGYDEATLTLEVRYRSGALWEYKNVSVASFLNLKEAESKGRYVA